MKMLWSCGLICLLVLGAGMQAVAQDDAALAAARAQAASGRNEEATQQYRALLEREPKNAAALSELADLLQAQGKWREAIPFLEHLLALQPQDAALLYQLGRMKSWQPEQRNAALELLRRACEVSDRNPEYCGAYAEVLSWRAETRAEAVARLQEVVKTHPEAVSPRIRLGQILSWNEATRPAALQLFDQGLQADPNNIELLLASAEVLSWASATRADALARFERVLAQQPDEPRALTGKAQILAWQNRSDEALELYQRVLAKDPQNPAALRGEATILNWKGRYAEARALAQRAHAAEPSNEQATLALAQAQIGLRRFAEARDTLSQVSGSPGREFDEARQEVHRALGTYLEFGFADRLENNLGFQRFGAALSTPLGSSHRITFNYQPTLYSTPTQGFNTNSFGVSLDSTVSERLTTYAYLGSEVYFGAATEIDGGFALRYLPRPSITVKAGFARLPVQESLLSTIGQNVGGVHQGQVLSNLARLGISYENAAHRYDLSFDYMDGVYTGRNLESNRRFSLEGQAGKALHSDQPYLRVGYYISYTSFDHDADIYTGVPITHTTGGYFSPTRFLLNQGVVNVSHRLGKKVEWGANGAFGVQNVETATSSFSNPEFAFSAGTHLWWRVSPTNEVRFAYEHLNVYNAFQRNLFIVTWRHYL